MFNALLLQSQSSLGSTEDAGHILLEKTTDFLQLQLWDSQYNIKNCGFLKLNSRIVTSYFGPQILHIFFLYYIHFLMAGLHVTHSYFECMQCGSAKVSTGRY